MIHNIGANSKVCLYSIISTFNTCTLLVLEEWKAWKLDLNSENQNMSVNSTRYFAHHSTNSKNPLFSLFLQHLIGIVVDVVVVKWLWLFGIKVNPVQANLWWKTFLLTILSFKPFFKNHISVKIYCSCFN